MNKLTIILLVIIAYLLWRRYRQWQEMIKVTREAVEKAAKGGVQPEEEGDVLDLEEDPETKVFRKK